MANGAVDRYLVHASQLAGNMFQHYVGGPVHLGYGSGRQRQQRFQQHLSAGGTAPSSLSSVRDSQLMF